jgi:ATP-dependent Clp protease ATP-binding subunit ClpB
VRITDGRWWPPRRSPNRYITGRQLPDKAIDLIDEAASRLRMEIDSSAREIDVLRAPVDRLTMEQFALEKERTPPPRSGWRSSQPSSPTSEKLRGLEQRWEAEKAGLNRVGDLKTEIDELRAEADKREREGDLTRRAEILYGQIPKLERELEAANGRGQPGPPMVKRGGRSRRGHRRGRLQAWTGIPVGR